MLETSHTATQSVTQQEWKQDYRSKKRKTFRGKRRMGEFKLSKTNKKQAKLRLGTHDCLLCDYLQAKRWAPQRANEEKKKPNNTTMFQSKSHSPVQLNLSTRLTFCFQLRLWMFLVLSTSFFFSFFSKSSFELACMFVFLFLIWILS